MHQMNYHGIKYRTIYKTISFWKFPRKAQIVLEFGFWTLWNSQLMRREILIKLLILFKVSGRWKTPCVYLQRRICWPNYSTKAASINKPLYLFSKPKMHRIPILQPGAYFCICPPASIAICNKIQTALAPVSANPSNCTLIPFAPANP